MKLPDFKTESDDTDLISILSFCHEMIWWQMFVLHWNIPLVLYVILNESLLLFGAAPP